MLFQLTNRTRSNLTGAEYGEFATLAKEFYASIPVDVEIRGEWAAADQSHNFLRCSSARGFPRPRSLHWGRSSSDPVKVRRERLLF